MLSSILLPAPHVARLPDSTIASHYKRLRWQIFCGIFVGYAGYYLVRKNFCLAMPHLIEEGYSRSDLGLAASGLSVSYGLSKFLMGSVSDRSNVQVFLPLGLFLSAIVVFALGFIPWATSSIAVMFALLFINGWVQGMGWAPCGRTMVHWWSQKERGSIVSLWNVSHNIGGGLIGPLFLLGMGWFNDWHAVFYVPAAVAAAVAIFALLVVRDTPQSCGLPPVEEYRYDYPTDYQTEYEQELSSKDIFLRYILHNTLLWWLAGASVFVHLIRYGILDWAPTYLKETREFSTDTFSWVYCLYEWVGIPGTLLCGWISDTVFSGRRAPAGILFMALLPVAVLVYWLNPADNPRIEIAALLSIGFLIYGPVMLIGLHAMELVPKKAAGTAAGFTGLFGYLAGSVAASALMGYIVDRFGWDSGFMLLSISCLMAILCMAMTLRPYPVAMTIRA